MPHMGDEFCKIIESDAATRFRRLQFWEGAVLAAMRAGRSAEEAAVEADRALDERRRRGFPGVEPPADRDELV